MYIVIICILVIAGYIAYKRFNGHSNSTYEQMVKLLSDAYSDASNGKRPLLHAVGDMPETDQILTNFYSLGCRFTGFIGPTISAVQGAFYDANIAVQSAVQAGCRTFILEIDYIKDCQDDKKYFPTLVVRDKQGKLIEMTSSIKEKCNSQAYSMIRETCEKINLYAFASSCQNASDPVIVVLYFLRQPPGAYNSSTVLDYFSNVAKMIAPLQDRFLQNEPTGTYYRQSQEGQLLMNKITAYNGKVLVFSNANTSGFREHSYASNEDLDFVTNLRLSYTQSQLGITDNTSGSTFGILQTAEDYMMIPSDRVDKTVNDTKLKWTICLSTDPFQSVSQKTYDTITSTYGVHCVPIILHDIPNNAYMFTDKLFKQTGFIPKPASLRYTKPPIVVPAQPNKSTDANGGMLYTPQVSK
jgi:hypothetical protein